MSLLINTVQKQPMICPITTCTPLPGMGQDIDFEVDLGEHQISSGSHILICSDGVKNMVELDEIDQFASSLEPKEFIHALIDTANQKGGVDNSTAISIRIS